MFLLIDEKGKRLFLPSDLLEVTITLSNREQAMNFIKFIYDISQKKGYYFQSHYLHERIMIGSILISPDLISIIHPYVEVMKSIIVLKNYNYEFDTEADPKEISLLDTNINKILSLIINSNFILKIINKYNVIQFDKF